MSYERKRKAPADPTAGQGFDVHAVGSFNSTDLGDQSDQGGLKSPAGPELGSAGGLDLSDLTHPGERACPITGQPLPIDAAEAVALRTKLLEACEDKDVRAQAIGCCCSSPIYWFNYFAFTYHVKAVGKDGRERPVSGPAQCVPFVTWPVQDRAITQLIECIDGGRDCLVDKSRDMGASWLLIALAWWYWRFRPGTHVLVTSRIEDLVDRAGNPDSLFWKLDYITSHVPGWMLDDQPLEYLRDGQHRSHMHLFYPGNGSSIDGQATTTHIGRGGRRTWIMFDEMAAMQGASAAWTAATDATSCKVANSTPIGAGTEFSRLHRQALESGEPKIVGLYYYDHPEKGIGRTRLVDDNGSVTDVVGRAYWSTPWFESQVTRRTTMDLAQNVLADHITSGNTFFNSRIVTSHFTQHGRESVGYEFDSEKKCFIKLKSNLRNSRWRVWSELDMHGLVDQDTNYVMGADISQGVGSSNSSLTVLNRTTGEQVAQFTDPTIAPYDFAELAADVGRTIFSGQAGQALLIWEVNGPGESWYKDLQKFDYSHIYFRQNLGTARDPRTKRYGWRSGRTEKRLLLASLDRALRRDEIILRDSSLMTEMMEYVFFDDGSIGPGLLRDETSGARESHGDRVISAALCVIGRSFTPTFEPSKKTYGNNTFGHLAGHVELDYPELVESSPINPFERL